MDSFVNRKYYVSSRFTHCSLSKMAEGILNKTVVQYYYVDTLNHCLVNYMVNFVPLDHDKYYITCNATHFFEIFIVPTLLQFSHL